MAAAVIERGADYAIRLKANNAPLFDAAVAAFAAAEARGGLRWHETDEHRHDRREWRRSAVIAAPADAPALPGLRAFGRIESERRLKGRAPRREVHAVALSQLLTPERLAEVFRAQWSVENHLHRQLDVVFREDQARTRNNHGPANLSVIRRMALDIVPASPRQHIPPTKDEPRTPEQKLPRPTLCLSAITLPSSAAPVAARSSAARSPRS